MSNKTKSAGFVQIAILTSAMLTVAAKPAGARPVQIVVDPTSAQSSIMIQGTQIVESHGNASEVRMASPEPTEDDYIEISFYFANHSDRPINIGPENVSASTLEPVPYDKLVVEQDRREGRRKFGNFLATFANTLAAADAGNQYGSFSYSGISSNGTMSMGSGSVTTYNPYLARRAQAEATIENQDRTERMRQSFAVTRSGLKANLRTTTIPPGYTISGIMTFKVPKALTRASRSQDFSISILVGTDRHVLAGYIGPIDTLPPVATLNDALPSTRYVTSPQNPAARPGRLASTPATIPAPTQLAPARSPAAGNVKSVEEYTFPANDGAVKIEAFRRGEYAGRPDMLATLAKQGFAPAQNELGTLYQLGKGVRQDDREAVRLFQLAARQQYRDAQMNLGWMLETGRGTRRNLVAAKQYYTLAARAGDPLARSRLVELSALQQK